MREIPLEQLSASRLSELISTQFNVQADGGQAIALVLASISQPRASGEYESFSLIFHGPVEMPLPQRTYTLEHASLGRFDLFIVPVGQDARGLQYQAVFNRVRRPA